jgi:acetyl-CoA carboxylase, biotin carboxylase subunit
VTPPFTTLLIANRGEVALRIIRTCREMGIRTVLVHSTSDRESAAARIADETVQIGPGAPRRSYLSAPAIIEAAIRTKAQAVHPGYGFLSEDPDFAEICADNGLVFVGPPPAVMARLSDKAAARRAMVDAGVPVLPGSAGTVATAPEAVDVAARIGFPLIIKAAAGGGGRGMTIVRARHDLAASFRSTSAVADAVFGDSRVYLEAYVEDARHIEVQILADNLGNVVHLGERDCSVQRRHQKMVEESPAPRLDDRLRSDIIDAAVRGTRETGYRGAGTFEFLVSGNTFAFIEVNCRIQVEHPVSEMVSGIDLVREQILVAAGRPLTISQDEVHLNGVAIECRVTTEDAHRDFAPRPGLITEFVPPGGPFVRVDTQGYAGFQMPSEYDSLLAKVIAWGPDREQAIQRLDRALGEFHIAGYGVCTTRDAVRDVLADPVFRAGAHTTTFLQNRTTLLTCD